MNHYEFTIIEEDDDLYGIHKSVFNEEGALIYETILPRGYETKAAAIEKIQQLCDTINN
jgi:hypothetical protein